MNWLERYREPIIGLLVVIALAGGILLLYRQFSLFHSEEIVISPPSTKITVYVEGEVVNPGVYALSDGNLVGDAVDAAGGFTSSADSGSVNLAGTLRDGEQVHIYKLGEAPQRININTAEAWLLEALPGIGEALAQKIIYYRTVNGQFQQIEDLMNVDGIGLSVFDKVKDKIAVR
jgi:competence protein ComEA